MANNRLYIVNPQTGALLHFARSNAPRGWTLVPTHEELQDFLEDVEQGDGIEDTDVPSVLKLVDDHTADAWQEHIARARATAHADSSYGTVGELIEGARERAAAKRPLEPEETTDGTDRRGS